MGVFHHTPIPTNASNAEHGLRSIRRSNRCRAKSCQYRWNRRYSWNTRDCKISKLLVFNGLYYCNSPLLILHHDKDGAVDQTQGIEYFNTLRRLQKPVVLLEYKGENHGHRKPDNMKDYTVRMKEFFDHYLMDKPAPKWLTDGVPLLKMKDHLLERTKDMGKPAAKPASVSTGAGAQ